MSTLLETIKKLNKKEELNLSELREAILKIAEDLIAKKFTEVEEEMHEELQELKDELSESIKEVTGKTHKGDKGDKPTSKELIDLIIPLIPPPVKGDSGKDAPLPTKKELLKLIKPLIPEVKDGYTPIKGKDYFDGKNGKDGTEIKPLEIAEKLNTTKQSVEMKVINGLEKALDLLGKNIQEALRKSGGGGMGQPQHERFSTSSSTTTITTAYPIAAGGLAIFGLFYNSGQLHRGRQYTVGSNRKTITLQFTPDDGTEITISYIRG